MTTYDERAIEASTKLLQAYGQQDPRFYVTPGSAAENIAAGKLYDAFGLAFEGLTRDYEEGTSGLTQIEARKGIKDLTDFIESSR